MNSYLHRRLFLKRSGLAIGSAALGSLLAQEHLPGQTPLLAHQPARAKSIIYLHMVGAPSQLDLFDAKPDLNRLNGQPCPESFIEGKRFAFIRGHPNLLGSPFQFARHGQSGQEISELFPHLARLADEMAIVRSIHTDEFNHGPAQAFLHTGTAQLGRPSFGSWIAYGLGNANQNLPAYVVMVTGADPGAGSSLWSTGFLPSVYQGVRLRSKGDPVLFLSNPAGHHPADRRRLLDVLAELNRAQLEETGDPEIATRISQYEMAFRMQTSVPELMDLREESPHTLSLYGAEPGRASFANHCLLARRLVERGVRVIELFDDGWDHHANLASALPKKCRQVDQPIAALLADLKDRGLLDQTLVLWAGEFGRTPMSQDENGDGRSTEIGRDHHKDAYSVWMAGGGVRGGTSYGVTDELGYSIAENPVHVHDLNATLLHLLGLDHERLVFRFQGREFRLTDVYGRLVTGLLLQPNTKSDS